MMKRPDRWWTEHMGSIERKLIVTLSNFKKISIVVIIMTSTILRHRR